MKKLVSLVQKTAAFFLLAIVLIGSIPPTTLPVPNTPGSTEPGKPDNMAGEESNKNNNSGNEDNHEASPCSDREGEEVHKN